VVLEAHDVVGGLLAHMSAGHVVDARRAVAGRVLGHALPFDHVDAQRNFEEVHDLRFDGRRAGQHELQPAS